eukprot:210316_1
MRDTPDVTDWYLDITVNIIVLILIIPLTFVIIRKLARQKGPYQTPLSLRISIYAVYIFGSCNYILSLLATIGLVLFTAESESSQISQCWWLFGSYSFCACLFQLSIFNFFIEQLRISVGQSKYHLSNCDAYILRILYGIIFTSIIITVLITVSLQPFNLNTQQIDHDGNGTICFVETTPIVKLLSLSASSCMFISWISILIIFVKKLFQILKLWNLNENHSGISSAILNVIKQQTFLVVVAATQTMLLSVI